MNYPHVKDGEVVEIISGLSKVPIVIIIVIITIHIIMRCDSSIIALK